MPLTLLQNPGIKILIEKKAFARHKITDLSPFTQITPISNNYGQCGALRSLPSGAGRRGGPLFWRREPPARRRGQDALAPGSLAAWRPLWAAPGATGPRGSPSCREPVDEDPPWPCSPLWHLWCSELMEADCNCLAGSPRGNGIFALSLFPSSGLEGAVQPSRGGLRPRRCTPSSD